MLPPVQIEDFNMVQFLPLDVTDEESIGVVLSHIDNAIQSVLSSIKLGFSMQESRKVLTALLGIRYGEHEEPKEPKDVRLFSFALHCLKYPSQMTPTTY